VIAFTVIGGLPEWPLKKNGDTVEQEVFAFMTTERN
jgi:hypothetical protein